MHEIMQQVFLIRHGETEWSRSGRHTGRTDIPLTDNGRRLAENLAPLLGKESFGLVLTSPMQRARETCELAGLAERAETDPSLCEWDYGHYEGLTPAQIHVRTPNWMIFRDGCPGGESPAQVAARVDGVIERVRSISRRCSALRPRTCLQGVCSALDRIAGAGRMQFSAGYSDAQHSELLSGHSRGQAMECTTPVARTPRVNGPRQVKRSKEGRHGNKRGKGEGEGRPIGGKGAGVDAGVLARLQLPFRGHDLSAGQPAPERAAQG